MNIIYRQLSFLLLAFIIIWALIWYVIYPYFFSEPETLKVGVLYSKTGTMAGSEQSIFRATLLAIDEVNRQGGVHGKRLVPIVYDAGSDWKRYAEIARKMILQDKVAVIFGCWVSAARKEVKSVVEKYDNLLIYPTQHEGIEESDNIIYLGSTPNQQLIPAAFWMFEHYGKKSYLVGSDYIYPHVANEILKHEILGAGGEVLGEAYFKLGQSNVDAVIRDILQKKPEVIFNTINGTTNIAFFNRLYELSRIEGAMRPPVMSFSLSPANVYAVGLQKMIGDYAAWSYFFNLDNPANRAFLQAYQKKYGSIDEINEPAVMSYSGVFLWAQAANQSSLLEPAVIRNFMLRRSFTSPEGVIYIDPQNGHSWKIVRIGELSPTGAYNVVWTSFAPIPPLVYPEFKTRAEWNLFEYKLYTQWGESWDARGK